MLQPLRFEHPHDNRSVDIGGWSYVWAGLFGVFYLIAMGFRRYAARAVLFDLGFLLALAALIGMGFLLRPAFIQWVAVAVGVPFLILLHGSLIIRILRAAYRRRGWRTLLR